MEKDFSQIDSGYIAIVDLGSNAVRAGIYNGLSIDAIQMYSSKFQFDLKKLLNAEDLHGEHDIYNIFEYFSFLFKTMGITKIFCVATELLRNNIRSKEFIEVVYNKTGLKIKIITGEEEGEFAALGLIYGVKDAEGLVADLGGGSLEFATVVGGSVQDVVSLPLGIKSCEQNDHVFTEDDLLNIINAKIMQKNFANIYLIGGSFRILCKYYMQFVRYPLKNLHNFVIDANSLNNYLNKLGEDLLIDGYNNSKVNSHAILVLKAIIRHFKPKNFIVSNYGLKEGLYFSLLPKAEQKKDVAYFQIKALANIDGVSDILEAYKDIFKNIMPRYDDELAYIIDLSLMLLETLHNIDNSLQDDYLINFIMTTSIPLSHLYRIMLMNIISGLFDSPLNKGVYNLSRSMLDRSRYQDIQIITWILKIIVTINGFRLTKPFFKFEMSGNGYLKYVIDIKLPRIIAFKAIRMVKELGKLIKRAKNSYQGD
ncbi:MAG: hypothetical protein K9G11_02985 [Rickettsiaceae bacterium]|nr:hypothetical protein [Rickettsiaceae bacterium]